MASDRSEAGVKVDRFNGVLRGEDVVARLGGDEFVILLYRHGCFPEAASVLADVGTLNAEQVGGTDLTPEACPLADGRSLARVERRTQWSVDGGKWSSTCSSLEAGIGRAEDDAQEPNPSRRGL